jgi:Uma2 family endonuclease
LGPLSEPQPDLAVLGRREDRYTGGHPTAADVLLIVEVSDSTLRYDRDVKAELYAKHGIPELWVVDVPDRRLHVFRQPRDGRYAERFVAETDTLPIPTLPKRVDLARLLSVSGRSTPRDA